MSRSGPDDARSARGGRSAGRAAAPRRFRPQRRADPHRQVPERGRRDDRVRGGPGHRRPGGRGPRGEAHALRGPQGPAVLAHRGRGADPEAALGPGPARGRAGLHAGGGGRGGASFRGGRVPADLHLGAALRRRASSGGGSIGGVPGRSRTRARGPCSPRATSPAAPWRGWSSTSSTSPRGAGWTPWTPGAARRASRGGSRGWWRRSATRPGPTRSGSIVFGLSLFGALAVHLGRVALRTRAAEGVHSV